MKEIREWLESGQDYAQGVALYETYGKSKVVLTALRYGATDFTRQKLVSELRKLLTQENVRAVDTSPKRVQKTGERVHVAPQSPSELVSLPVKNDELGDELRRQRSTWYAERARLHAQLELVATDAERRVMAERILVLSEQIAASYDEAAPVAEPRADLLAITDQGEMRRLLANLRPQRSKLKNRPDRAADLAQVESDIQLLEGRLTRDGGEPEL